MCRGQGARLRAVCQPTMVPTPGRQLLPTPCLRVSRWAGLLAPLLRTQITLLRRDGLIAPIEFDLGTSRSLPPTPLVSQSLAGLSETFQRSGIQPSVGSRLWDPAGRRRGAAWHVGSAAPFRPGRPCRARPAGRDRANRAPADRADRLGDATTGRSRHALRPTGSGADSQCRGMGAPDPAERLGETRLTSRNRPRRGHRPGRGPGVTCPPCSPWTRQPDAAGLYSGKLLPELLRREMIINPRAVFPLVTWSRLAESNR